MSEQTTEETTEDVSTDVQPEPLSEDNLIDDVVDGLLEEFPETPAVGQPEEEAEVEEEPAEPEPEKEPEKAETHRVKVDGEEFEVDYDELVKGYQTSKSLTQRGQQLADERRQMAPIFGLAKRLQEDPEFAQHVFGYGKEAEPDITDDPIAQIKSEAKKEVLSEVDKRFEKQTADAHQAEINSVKARVQQDPLYNQVHDKLGEYVNSMPVTVRKQVYNTLDRDPATYLELYDRFRKELEPGKPTEQPEAEQPPERVAPPALVASGQPDETPVKAAKKLKIDKKRAEILRSGDADALEDYFLMDGGLIDTLGL